MKGAGRRSPPRRWLDGELVFEVPARLTDVRSWHGHIPFAFWLVEECRPRVFVELGTHKGDSYCAFCQIVDRLALPTQCYAVDTWKGDPHAGEYGEEVYEELLRYHEPRYSSFSRLVRSTFDEAALHFANGSIDLLHIDGLHTYEAVRHDFERWRSKLSDRAIVVVHDVNVRERGFGVWQFWEELRTAVPSFTFLHGHGLGVAAVGSRMPVALEAFFKADEREVQRIRKVFGALGDSLQRRTEARDGVSLSEDEKARLASDLERARKELEAQRHVAEEHSRLQSERERELQELRENLASAGMERDRHLQAISDLQEVLTGLQRNTAEWADRESAMTIAIEQARQGQQKQQTIAARLQARCVELEKGWAGERERFAGDLARLEEEREQLDGSLVQSRTKLADLEILRSQLAADQRSTRAESDARVAELDSELEAARAEVRASASDAQAARNDLQSVRESLVRATALLSAAQGSFSWRITAPFRRLTHRFPRLRRIPWFILRLHWALTFQLRKLRRRTEAIAALAKSGLFDAAYYLQRYPEVTGTDPLIHYFDHGAAELKDPNPFFSTSYYLEHNPDVRAAGLNPLLHYLVSGASEQRQPGPDFCGRTYLELHDDLSGIDVNPLAHYLKWGIAEGRRRWPAPAIPRTTLPEQPAALPDADRASILVVDHRLLTPDMDSGSVRMTEIIQLFLRFGYSVTFVADNDTIDRSYAEPLKRMGVQVLWGLAATQEYLRRAGESFRHAVLSRPVVAERYLATVRAYAPFAQVTYDSVDLHWIRLRRAAELLGDAEIALDAEFHRRLEGFAFEFSDTVVAITDAERLQIEAEWPQVRVAVVPNIHHVRPLSAPWPRRRGLMFIGGYEHLPNVDAVTWFTTEVLPLIRRELPEVQFRMVGSRPPDGLKALVSPGVELVGYVPDADPFFEQARVFVAPLRYGAGMKGKIGHAMSLGLPVVTTTIGAEGMLLEDGVHALVADTAEAFASAVLRLYGDERLWSELRKNALVHIERNFSEAPVANALERLLARECHQRQPVAA